MRGDVHFYIRLDISPNMRYDGLPTSRVPLRTAGEGEWTQELEGMVLLFSIECRQRLSKWCIWTCLTIWMPSQLSTLCEILKIWRLDLCIDAGCFDAVVRGQVEDIYIEGNKYFWLHHYNLFSHSIKIYL